MLKRLLNHRWLLATLVATVNLAVAGGLLYMLLPEARGQKTGDRPRFPIDLLKKPWSVPHWSACPFHDPLISCVLGSDSRPVDCLPAFALE